MKTSMKFFLGCALAFAFGATAQAQDAQAQTSTVWNGGLVNATINKVDGYTFQSVYQSPAHAYEMSGHMVSPNGVNHDIPQTLVLAPATEAGTWTPDGLYVSGSSNYEVGYCCDSETGYDNGIAYKRVNLEDSTYYTAENAAAIRAILTNVYPYVTMDAMKAKLAAEGFEGAAQLTRADIISGVQAAIWFFANGVDYSYSRSFNVPKNTQWGASMHEFSSELDAKFAALGKRQFLVDEEVGARVDGLRDYLKAKGQAAAENYLQNGADQKLIVSQLEIVDAVPVQEKENCYNVAVQVAMNGAVSEGDEVALSVFVDDELVNTCPVEAGCSTYDWTVEAQAGQTVKAVVSGSQTLPAGVYFYEPQGGRDVSQSLVGVAGGVEGEKDEIYVETETQLKAPASTATGALTLQKVDQDGAALSGAEFELYTAGENAVLYVDTYAVDENGALTVEGLVPGAYALLETVAPTGYMGCEEPIYFEIDAEGNLVGEEVYEGVLTVVNVAYNIDFLAGTASNISYMLIDPTTGAVEFLYKIDLDSNDTSAPIVARDGYISAVFVKQSTSGLLWIAEEVDEATVDATLACVKRNNKSYKTCDAIVFGTGSHDLTYTKGKKDKTVTFQMNAGAETPSEATIKFGE